MNRKKIISFSIISVMAMGLLTSYDVKADDTTNKEVNITVNSNEDNKAISPYIYGVNYSFTAYDGNVFPFIKANRIGGNRFTAYNWENNASNAGSDWYHTSDGLLNRDDDESVKDQPGEVYTKFQDKAIEKGSEYSLVTLQMAGYAAKDKKGTSVTEEEKAPSDRWVAVKAKKDGELSLNPDKTDDCVYMDELVNFLKNKYGSADYKTGIKGYSLDNEPSLWSYTHARIHPDALTCNELISRSTELSKAVKGVDSKAEVFGPALYGQMAYASLQEAPDWDKVKGSYDWFVDYYLDKMKKASDDAGERLLDVFDIHYYSEATDGSSSDGWGGNRINSNEDIKNIDQNKARMQAPRTLWDPNYKEKSWIGQWVSNLPLIPKMQESINKYYPGTKFSITEYNFGAPNHISGGIAQADTLGIFGNQGVYYAAGSALRTDESTNYYASAFKLFTDYDGSNSEYGDTSIKASTSDNDNSSVYASLDSKDPNKMHVIILNKNYDDSEKVKFNLITPKGKVCDSAKVYAFDENSSEITEREEINSIDNNKFIYEVPKLTACHMVINLKSDLKIGNGDVNGDGKVNISDYLLLRRYINGGGDRNNYKINKENADLNGDGKYDFSDLLKLRAMI